MTVSNVLYHFLPIWPRGNGRGTRKRVIPATAWPIFPFFWSFYTDFLSFSSFSLSFFVQSGVTSDPLGYVVVTLVGNFRFIRGASAPSKPTVWPREHSFPLRGEGKQANRNRSVAASYPCKQKPCPLLMRYAPIQGTTTWLFSSASHGLDFFFLRWSEIKTGPSYFGQTFDAYKKPWMKLYSRACVRFEYMI